MAPAPAPIPSSMPPRKAAAHRATAYFDIPPDRVMEVGSQIEL